MDLFNIKEETNIFNCAETQIKVDNYSFEEELNGSISGQEQGINFMVLKPSSNLDVCSSVEDNYIISTIKLEEGTIILNEQIESVGKETMPLDIFTLYNCVECNVTFDGWSSYHMHLQTKHNSPLKYETISDETSENCDTEFSKPEHIVISNNIFPTELALNAHNCAGSDVKSYKIHYGTTSMHTPVVKNYKCDVCPSSYISKYLLKTHKKIHIKDKPFKCYVCNSSFTFNSYLQKHIKIHNDDRLFKCDVCIASFSSKKCLVRHKVIHTPQVEPYNCNVCGFTFGREIGFKSHMVTHTEPVQHYKCDMCTSGFTTSHHLITHKKIHTYEKMYKCALPALPLIKI